MRDLVHHLLRQDETLAEPIKDATALSASLAAVSVAVFIVLPTFHHLLRSQGVPVFTGYRASRRMLRGLHTLAVASGLFCASVVVGIPGRHFACRLVLYFQETVTTVATMLFFVAIYVVWRSTSGSLGQGDPSGRRSRDDPPGRRDR